jgi:hypothetical protein
MTVVKISSAFILFILLLSCNDNYSEEIKISNFTPKTIKTDFELPSGKYVERIEIQVNGEANDYVKLGKYKLSPGKIDTSYSHDWYSNDYSIKFDPLNASEGALTIKIEFIVL